MVPWRIVWLLLGAELCSHFDWMEGRCWLLHFPFLEWTFVKAPVIPKARNMHGVARPGQIQLSWACSCRIVKEGSPLLPAASPKVSTAHVAKSQQTLKRTRPEPDKCSAGTSSVLAGNSSNFAGPARDQRHSNNVFFTMTLLGLKQARRFLMLYRPLPPHHHILPKPYQIRTLLCRMIRAERHLLQAQATAASEVKAGERLWKGTSA